MSCPFSILSFINSQHFVTMLQVWPSAGWLWCLAIMVSPIFACPSHNFWVSYLPVFRRCSPFLWPPKDLCLYSRALIMSALWASSLPRVVSSLGDGGPLSQDLNEKGLCTSHLDALWLLQCSVMVNTWCLLSAFTRGLPWACC